MQWKQKSPSGTERKPPPAACCPYCKWTFGPLTKWRRAVAVAECGRLRCCGGGGGNPSKSKCSLKGKSALAWPLFDWRQKLLRQRSERVEPRPSSGLGQAARLFVRLSRWGVNSGARVGALVYLNQSLASISWTGARVCALAGARPFFSSRVGRRCRVSIGLAGWLAGWRRRPAAGVQLVTAPPPPPLGHSALSVRRPKCSAAARRARAH